MRSWYVFHSYKDVLKDARKHELLQHDVILCTCTAASQPSLAATLDLKQIIIDECAMATEPEAFIPLVAHKPEQVRFGIPVIRSKNLYLQSFKVNLLVCYLNCLTLRSRKFDKSHFNLEIIDVSFNVTKSTLIPV